MLPYRAVAWPSTGLAQTLTLTLALSLTLTLTLTLTITPTCTTGIHHLSCMVAYIYVGVCWVTMRAALVKEAREEREFRVQRSI